MGVYSFKYQIKSDSLHFITKRPLVRGSFQTAKRNFSRVSERVLVFNYETIQRLLQFGNWSKRRTAVWKLPRTKDNVRLLSDRLQWV
jgi:hypothetical protein